MVQTKVELETTVVIPCSLEVRLCGWIVGELQSVDVVGDILEDLRRDFLPVLDLVDEPLLTLRGGSVETEQILTAEVAMSEGVEVLVRVLKSASVTQPGRLGNLVVEEPTGQTFAPVLVSGKVDDVGLQTLHVELDGCLLRLEVIPGLVPHFTTVDVDVELLSMF